MPTCSIPSSFFDQVNKEITVVHDGSLTSADLGNGYSRVANVSGNTLTGYYSPVATCNLTPGVLPGKWLTPLVWESYCQGFGINRELTLIELYGNACGNNRSLFCASLKDQGGNLRKPEICGGTDPNVYTYNPVTAAIGGLTGQFGNLQTISDQMANDVILANRKKIFSIAFVILLLLAIVFLIISI